MKSQEGQVEVDIGDNRVEQERNVIFKGRQEKNNSNLIN